MTKRVLLSLLVLIATGCGSPLPTAADPQRAKVALQTSLDAWKVGASADSLQQQSPAIYFNDEIWQAQHKLTKFELGEGQANGMGWRCEAALTVTDTSGQTTERKISYQIDTDPVIVIVQQP